MIKNLFLFVYLLVSCQRIEKDYHHSAASLISEPKLIFSWNDATRESIASSLNIGLKRNDKIFYYDSLIRFSHSDVFDRLSSLKRLIAVDKLREKVFLRDFYVMEFSSNGEEKVESKFFIFSMKDKLFIATTELSLGYWNLKMDSIQCKDEVISTLNGLINIDLNKHVKKITCDNVFIVSLFSHQKVNSRVIFGFCPQEYKYLEVIFRDGKNDF